MLTLERYLKASPVKVVLGCREYFSIDRELEQLGKKRHGAVNLPNFVPATRVVMGIDLARLLPT